MSGTIIAASEYVLHVLVEWSYALHVIGLRLTHTSLESSKIIGVPVLIQGNDITRKCYYIRNSQMFLVDDIPGLNGVQLLSDESTKIFQPILGSCQRQLELVELAL